jgi:hypothetical protein
LVPARQGAREKAEGGRIQQCREGDADDFFDQPIRLERSLGLDAPVEALGRLIRLV